MKAFQRIGLAVALTACGAPAKPVAAPAPVPVEVASPEGPSAAAAPVEKPHRFKVPIGHAPTRGAANAKVTVVEYSDFQCPFCQRSEATMQALAARYGDDLRIVWKHDPMPFHEHAIPAALLSLEAQREKGDPGFWAAHDALFAAGADLTDAGLAATGKRLGLEAAKVKAAMRSEAYRDAIDQDLEEADDFGVEGTPCFFINGLRLEGAQPLAAFVSIIDDELRATRDLPAATSYYDQRTYDGEVAAAPPKLELPVPANAPSRGSVGARVVVQELADFECPYCRMAEANVAELLKDYGDRVRFVFRNVPLPMHPHAAMAAEAALEAFEQKGAGGFWRMHDRLFAAPAGGLARDGLEADAKALGLDLARFRHALDAGTHAEAVEADRRAAEAAGVEGVPVFLVNGYAILGAQPYAKVRRVVERALQEAEAKEPKAP